MPENKDYCQCPDFGYYQIDDKICCQRCNREKPPGYQQAMQSINRWEQEAKEAWRKIDIYKGEADRYKKEYITLQSQCTKKEKECEEFKRECKRYLDLYIKTYEALEELKAENIRLSGLLVSLSNGEAMNVVRESEGVYSVIFKTSAK